jgi:hypothetical protein
MHYSSSDQNKMASRCDPVTDEETFVLNKVAVSPNMEKAPMFCARILLEALKFCFLYNNYESCILAILASFVVRFAFRCISLHYSTPLHFVNNC